MTSRPEFWIKYRRHFKPELIWQADFYPQGECGKKDLWNLATVSWQTGRLPPFTEEGHCVRITFRWDCNWQKAVTLRVLAPPAAGAAIGRSFSGGPLGRTVALRMRARAGQGRSGAAGFSPRAQVAALNLGAAAAGPPASRSGARRRAFQIPKSCPWQYIPGLDLAGPRGCPAPPSGRVRVPAVLAVSLVPDIWRLDLLSPPRMARKSGLREEKAWGLQPRLGQRVVLRRGHTRSNSMYAGGKCYSSFFVTLL